MLLSEDGARLALAILVLSDNSLSHWLANLSDSLGRFPDDAAVSAILESLDNFGILHDVSPHALGGVDGSSSGDSALLESSLESAENLGLSDLGGSALGDASGPFFLVKLSGLAVGVLVLEFLNKLSFLWNFEGGS